MKPFIFDYIKSLDKVCSVTSMTPESLDNMAKKCKELAEKFMMEEINKSILNYDPNTIPCTSASPSEFSIEEFEKAMQTLKDMPPIVVEMEVYKSVYDKLRKHISKMNTNLPDSLKNIPRLNGVRIIAIDRDDDFNENQTKLIYNNGTSKIVDL